MKSIWSEQTDIPEGKALSENIVTEAAVIGAGMAGILTACFLQSRGIRTVVLEAERTGSGQTKNTTAKITSQHGLIYHKLIKKYGERAAAIYAQANEEALHTYEKIIKEYQIDCDFEKLPAYLYSVRKAAALQEEARAASSLGLAAHFVKDNELPFENAGAVCFEDQAQFDPLKFLKRLSQELTIYENTRVLSVKGHRILTDRGHVEADHIIFATHYPFINVPGLYFMRQHQERSYVLALSGADKLHGMYYSADEKGISLRSYRQLLLLGGGAHRTGVLEKGCGYETLRQQAEQYYPGCQEVSHWSAQDCVTHDDFPFIGKYSLFRPYWYVATGFKKWGMTASMLSALLISDEICGRENPYAQLFSPQRFYPWISGGNLLKDFGMSVKGLCTWKTPRCPHMGCALEWNPQDKSWDCPCHGSRFRHDGKLIDNPAQKNCKEK